MRYVRLCYILSTLDILLNKKFFLYIQIKLLHKVNFHKNIIQFFGITERKSKY
jgi:hypothetical protein